MTSILADTNGEGLSRNEQTDFGSLFRRTHEMTTLRGRQLDPTTGTLSAESNSQANKTSNDETALSRRDRARHVAGHATLALAQGIAVELLTIEKPASVIVDRDGARFIDAGTMLHISTHWPKNLFERSRLANCLVRIALAGRCAELICQDGPHTVEFIQDDETDWQLAWKTASQCFQDETLRLQYLEQEVQRTATFLRHDQSLAVVANVSTALLECSVLNERSVNELCDQNAH